MSARNSLIIVRFILALFRYAVNFVKAYCLMTSKSQFMFSVIFTPMCLSSQYFNMMSPWLERTSLVLCASMHWKENGLSLSYQMIKLYVRELLSEFWCYLYRAWPQYETLTVKSWVWLLSNGCISSWRFSLCIVLIVSYYIFKYVFLGIVLLLSDVKFSFRLIYMIVIIHAPKFLVILATL